MDVERALKKLEWRNKRFYFQQMLEQLEGYPDDTFMLEQLREYVNRVIGDHRITIGKNAHYHFSVIITGPKQSGKSLMLSILLEHVLAEFVATDVYKSNIVFIFDFPSMHFTDLDDFYQQFITVLFTQIAIQRPSIAQYKAKLIEFFTGIIPLPKDLDRLLQSDLNDIRTVMKNSTTVESWITNVFLLPSLLGEAFGFTKVHVIADSVDLLNTTLSTSRFEDSSPINMIDYFRFGIKDISYILVCNGEPQTDDFSYRSEIIKFGNIDRQLEPDNTYFRVGDRNVRFEDCIGIPYFIKLFTDITKAYSSDDEEKEENVKDRMRAFLKAVYGEDEEIESVKRIL